MRIDNIIKRDFVKMLMGNFFSFFNQRCVLIMIKELSLVIRVLISEVQNSVSKLIWKVLKLYSIWKYLLYINFEQK